MLKSALTILAVASTGWLAQNGAVATVDGQAIEPNDLDLHSHQDQAAAPAAARRGRPAPTS